MTTTSSVEVLSNMIVRHVRVDRTVSPMVAISVETFTSYLHEDVVNTMPRGEGEEVDVHFVSLGRYVSTVDLPQEVDKLGFRLADPFSLASVVKEDPALTDSQSLATQWRNKDGQTCYALFGRWLNEREVEVFQDGGDWRDSCWFACLRK